VHRGVTGKSDFKQGQGYVRTWKRPALIPHRNSITLRPANFPNPPNRCPNRPNRGYCSRGVPIVLLLHSIVLYCSLSIVLCTHIACTTLLVQLKCPDAPTVPKHGYWRHFRSARAGKGTR
jgi:hypothetical protein